MTDNKINESEVNSIFNEVIQILSDFVAIPFVSTSENDPTLMKKSAEFVYDQFNKLGFKLQYASAKVEHGDFEGNTAIIGYLGASESGEIDQSKQTILLYAHHDVQPVANPAAWKTNPFEATIIGERMFGRGSADDGAGISSIIGAIKLLKNKYSNQSQLPVNIKIFIEGEEEIGSPSFTNFIKKYTEELKSDVIIVADSGNWAVGTPSITSYLRGVATVDVELSVLEHTIHSGMSSGPIIDANALLMKTISSIWDDSGEINISGIFGTINSTVGKADEPEIDYTDEQFRADSGILPGVELAGSGSIAGRIWHKPSVTVIGFDATPISKSSNVFAASSKARLSLRVPPGQKSIDAANALIDHLKNNVPFGAHFDAKIQECGPAFKADIESPAAKAYATALEKGYEHEVVYSGMGGSIPFTASLSEVFPSAQILIAGVEDPDSRAHSDNESVHLGDLKKCVKSFFYLFEELAK